MFNGWFDCICRHLPSVRNYGGILNKYFTVAPVATKDGTFTIPHMDHGQHYHTLQGAKYESLSLYVEQSQFRQKLRTLSAASVLDVGLGLGYNALTTIEAWHEDEAPCVVSVISLEVDEELFFALTSGNAPWQKNWPKVWLDWVTSVKKEQDFYQLILTHPKNKATCTWKIYIADGFDWVKENTKAYKFHFIWQDAFTPELNPRLWSTEFFSGLKTICAQDVILLTYSVARIVKNALGQANWTYSVLRGKKLHKDWLKAWLIN